MVSLLRISWRNVWRSRRRTLISMSAVGFGLFILLFGLGILEAFFSDAQNEMGPTGRGHVEVNAPDYRIKRDVGKAIAEPDAVVAAILARAPEGSRAGWRVESRCLVSSAWGSRGVTLHGVEPDSERELTDFFSAVQQGAQLEAGDDRGIMVGVSLAKKLKLEVDSKLTLMAQRADGEVGAELFRVRGIFKALSPSASLSRVFITAKAARGMLGLGEVAHEIVVQLPKAALADPMAVQLKAEFGERLQVLSFAELYPGLKAMDEILDTFLFFIVFGIFFLVGLGILNTMLMSVMERTREWGVMMAVGTRPRRLVAMVVGETFWIATLSVVVGFVLGVLVNWSAAEHGWLDFTAAGEGFDYMGTTINALFRPVLPLGKALQTTAMVWVLTVLFGLYPAWRASKLKPADALRAS
jgi:ABC-type lipoprotein release transport system permease subunit